MRISDWSSDVCSSDLDERIGQAARHARILDPAIFHQVRADILEVDRGHRAVLLRERDVIDLEPVDAVGADDLDLFDLEPRAADDLGIFLVDLGGDPRSEEHTSELQSLMRISYAVFCL